MEMIQPEELYEIHIIVNKDEVAQLFKFWANLEDDNMINSRCTMAQSFYGNYPIQPMLTYWLRGDNKSCIYNAYKTGTLMRNQGLSILRVKIEAVATNASVPKVLENNDVNYYEFHFKVGYKESTTIAKQWNEIAIICSLYGSHLFFNPYSKKGMMLPVITLRRYNTTYANALNDALDLSIELGRYGYKQLGEIQKEYSVSDSNVLLDANWLFTDSPTNFIKDVPVLL